MSKNLMKRSLSLAATLALGLTGMVALPAQAAPGDLVLKPTAGTNLGAFSTDDFEMDLTVPVAVGISPVALAFEVRTEQKDIQFDVDQVGAPLTSVAVRGYKADGTEVDMAAFVTAGAANSDSGDKPTVVSSLVTDLKPFAIDLAGAAVSRVVVSSLTAATTISEPTYRVAVKPLVDTTQAAYAYGGGTPKPITVQGWLDTNSNVSNIESNFASNSATVTYYDPKSVAVIPRVERIVESTDTDLFNEVGSKPLSGSLEFVRPDLNLEQVHLSQWHAKITASTGGTSTSYAAVSSIDLAGYSGGKMDNVGRVNFKVSGTLSSSYNYKWDLVHTADATRVFSSAAFTPPANSTAREIYPTVTDTANAIISNVDTVTSVDNALELRPGVNAFTYNARLYATGTTTREKVASQLILAKVTAGSLMPAGTELTVSGVNQKLTRAGEAVVTSGFSNSDGDFKVTVSSSNPVAGTSYDVTFYSLATDGTWTDMSTATGGGSTKMTATYTAATVSSITPTSSVLSGDTVNAEFTIKDNYGVVTNKSGTSDLYVTIQATDKTNLDQVVAVGTDGKAAFSFTNYLGAGESDSIVVYAHSGATYANANQKATTTVSLYNPGAVAAVNAPANYTGVITYGDFITGAASSTNIAPTDATRISTTPLTGTVVDANGSGVPGAVVTVDAAGMQLRKSGAGDYFQDSITLSADAAGVFSVDMWSHVVNTTGVDVTITSGGQSATSKVKTYLPEGLDGNNLVFSVDAPANIDVNKTYAIQASLTDKWGNPVQTSDATVDIIGVGSVEINSASAGAVDKNFGKDGKVTVFVRSIKDIEGPGTITATLEDADYTAWNGSAAITTATLGIARIATDVATTAHDETSFDNSLEIAINVGEAAPSTSTQKVNAGSFKGYVAVYALGYEGSRLSAKIGNDWVIVDPIVNNESANLARVTDFTGAGVDIAVRIYIDRVLIDTINLTTK